MAKIVSIIRKEKENNMGALRRFRQAVSSSGALKHLRKTRYFERAQSPLTKKRSALVRIKRGKEHEKLLKLGKITEKPSRR